jgi:hypothetical protein
MSLASFKRNRLLLHKYNLHYFLFLVNVNYKFCDIFIFWDVLSKFKNYVTIFSELPYTH